MNAKTAILPEIHIEINNDAVNPKTLEAMRETDEILRGRQKFRGFTSLADMYAAMDAEDDEDG